MLHVACVWLDIYVCDCVCIHVHRCACVYMPVFGHVCVCLHLSVLACAHMYLLLCACLCVNVPHKTTCGVAHYNVFLVSLVIYTSHGDKKLLHILLQSTCMKLCIWKWSYDILLWPQVWGFCGLSPNNPMHSGSGDRLCRWWKGIFCMTVSFKCVMVLMLIYDCVI